MSHSSSAPLGLADDDEPPDHLEDQPGAYLDEAAAEARRITAHTTVKAALKAGKTDGDAATTVKPAPVTRLCEGFSGPNFDGIIRASWEAQSRSVGLDILAAICDDQWTTELFDEFPVVGSDKLVCRRVTGRRAHSRLEVVDGYVLRRPAFVIQSKECSGVYVGGASGKNRCECCHVKRDLASKNARSFEKKETGSNPLQKLGHVFTHRGALNIAQTVRDEANKEKARLRKKITRLEQKMEGLTTTRVTNDKEEIGTIKTLLESLESVVDEKFGESSREAQLWKWSLRSITGAEKTGKGARYNDTVIDFGLYMCSQSKPHVYDQLAKLWYLPSRRQLLRRTPTAKRWKPSFSHHSTDSLWVHPLQHVSLATRMTRQ